MRELFNYLYRRPQALPVIIIAGFLTFWIMGQAFPFIMEQLRIVEEQVVGCPPGG